MLVAIVGVALCAAPTAAWAHAERSASTPREGATLDKVPSQLSIQFTEPPTGDAVVEITDACDADVVSNIEVSGTEIVAALDEGQPGTWRVNTAVISTIDGHQTRDRWTFEVAGKADCSEQATGPRRGDEPDPSGASSQVAVMIAIATVIVLGVALVVRSLSGRNVGDD